MVVGKVRPQEGVSPLRERCPALLVALSYYSNGPGVPVDVLSLDATEFAQSNATVGKHTYHALVPHVVRCTNESFHLLVSDAWEYPLLHFRRLNEKHRIVLRVESVTRLLGIEPVIEDSKCSEVAVLPTIRACQRIEEGDYLLA